MKTLRIGCGAYDRIRALQDGRVGVEGYETVVKPMDVRHIVAAFDNGEIDLAEIALGQLLGKVDQGDPVYRGVPVFLSMSFRHDAVYGRVGGPVTSLGELAGTRIGVPQYFGTSIMWIRGMLEEQYGVDFSTSQWVVGPVDKPAGVLKQAHPANVACSYVARGDSLGAMIDRGDVDALFSYEVPNAFKAGRLTRLIKDVEEGERRFHNRFGTPLAHVLVGRSEDFDADPALSRKLLAAFTEAKSLALAALSDTACYTSSIPFLAEVVERAKRDFGEDFWPYGVEANRKAIETFSRYAHKQGLTRRLLKASEIFH